MGQLSLFADTPKPSKEDRWRAFLTAHPWFLPAVVQRARELKASGVKRWSTKAAFEMFRYRCRRDGQYGLNNNYTSICARQIMREFPDLKGFFETR